MANNPLNGEQLEATLNYNCLMRIHNLTLVTMNAIELKVNWTDQIKCWYKYDF
jgi:hypothetical protein